MCAGSVYERAANLFNSGKPGEAAEMLRGGIAADSTRAEYRFLLSVVLGSLGKWDEAIVEAREAVRLRANAGEAHNQLARSLRAAGRRGEAIEAYRAGIAAAPQYAPNYCHLGEALYDAGQGLESMAAFRQAIRVRPDYAEAFYGVGLNLSAVEELEEAIKCYQKAIELRPNFAEAHNNLGNALKNLGAIGEACAAYRAALAADPSSPMAHSNLILSMLYLDQWDAGAILEEMKKWDRLHAEPVRGSIRPHLNDRSPDRRLRIGYVSSEVFNHVLSRNLLPLWQNHDHSQFEIYCYASVRKPDRFTERVRGVMDVWRDVGSLDDAGAARLIREDGIDILVDLAGHMGETRLSIFAYKPAPVQVTFGGYPGGTGLGTMDYHITDPFIDPPGVSEKDYVERLIRLKGCWWCYDFSKMEVTEAVGPAPAASAGFVTFGCLNSFCKISDRTLATWKKLLAATGNSRLMLLTPPGTQGGRILEALGVGADRVIFAKPRPRGAYLKLYHGIDIFLDTLPYNGHTTAMDALAMGVPVVTQSGGTAVGRAGVSILNHIGLPELIGNSEEEYVRIARELAGDLPRLLELRKGMRERMRGSRLMDGAGFARDVEGAFRPIWREWCAAAK